MASENRLRSRQAHAPGATYLAYTPNGKKLITAGVDNYCRVFTTGSDDEPITVDDCQENNAAVVAGNGFFITGSEDGTVSRFSLEGNKFEEILVRTTLPVRDVALSPDGKWIAVASDELSVSIVNTKDMTKVRTLREQPRAVKHVSFDKKGDHLAISCTDGNIYVYSLEGDEPEMVKKVDGMIKSLETESESSSRVLWHPDGRAFATPTALRDVQVMSTYDWARQRVFKTSHTADITAAAWSPNGALLVTTSHDLDMKLWDTKTQKLLKIFGDIKATILAMVWHPSENTLSYTNNEGELFIHTDFVPEEHLPLLNKPTVSAPFFHDPSEGRAGLAPAPQANGTTRELPGRPRQRDGTPDSLDDLLGPDFRDDEARDDGDEDMEDFVVDDDGAGYAQGVNGHGKRTSDHLNGVEPSAKKRATTSSLFHPQIHEPFQPGSTPWRGNRRLLCCSLTGNVETVSQEGRHHTVTVNFYDQHTFRNFHFTDIFLYDKACLNENGTLFACQANSAGDGNPAMIYYRPHETWTTRTDWRTNLPTGESVTAIALSDSYVCVTTSTNYVRIYSLFGLPIRVYRQKSSPAVTCAAWRDYILTIGNGPVQSDLSTQLLYTIENIKHDTIYQDSDILALPPNTTLESAFFSMSGDPYIYDSSGVLLTLLNWRTNGQARWVPMLDTQQLSRLATGGKEETYWPVGVAPSSTGEQKFHCMIIKGRERYPSAPVPHLSEFGMEIPLSSAIDKKALLGADAEEGSDDEDAGRKKGETKQQEHEQAFILSSTLHTQLSSTLTHTRPSADQKRGLTNLEVAIDRALLQLLGLECLAGEDHGMKALEIVSLMRNANGKMLDLAGKVASRYGRDVLGEKIRELAENKAASREDDDDEYV
ncbi:tricorn protease domain 2-containing protein [Didymella exigua CBS 183.55]|uniref:Tricorn protease domain 2-containing protein n=1 Tax=Didymella exigua CBS 183.55 TaxID=1150837 RepID=A0A6A5RFS3_9PLEO|nr:tricorn protease domain 2-containing protein [Didymella exigua CBS 183.55]KAF1926592.1 tricorn protease domain 2-containing protein [Didymella exigua CBS 183.55]